MIRLYIVTYRRNEILNRSLRSLWASLDPKCEIAVTVLANHPEVVIDEENKRDCLTVAINTTRPTNAWAYLARDWNFGLLDAFRDSGNPRGTSWAVLAQNDVVWVPGWDSVLANEARFDFISQPRGDQMMAFRIEGVRAVGFFDERFCTLHFQETDYFYRAILKLGDRASIHDDHCSPWSHWHPLEVPLIEPNFSGNEETDNLHTVRFHSELSHWFMHKWKNGGRDVHNLQRNCELFRASGRRMPEEINWYPFFWVSAAPATRDFLRAYDAPPRSLERALRHVRDRLPAPAAEFLQTAWDRARRR
jgi:hypothetical protein